jgi:hypothetical protein
MRGGDQDLFFRLGLVNVRRNLARSMLSIVSMAVAAAVLTSALFLASGYPGQAFLPLRVFAGGDIMIFPRALSLGSASGGLLPAGEESPQGASPGTGEGAAAAGYVFGQLERDWISDLYAYHPVAYDYGVLHREGQVPWFDVEEITAKLSALPFVLDVYPYYTLPAMEVFFDRNLGYEKSGLAAIRGRDVEKDREFFYFQDYLTFGRPLTVADEGSFRALVDTGRYMSAGYGAIGEFGGGGREVLVPRVRIVPDAGRAVFDYSAGQTYSFQTVGGFRIEGYSTPQLVVSLELFRQIWGEATGGAPLLVPQVSVSVASLFTVESAVRQLRDLLPDCTVVSVPAAATEGAARGGFPESWSQWRRRPGEASVVAGQMILPAGVKTVMMVLTCMLGALIVAANSLVMLTQRRREIGVLRAIGAKRRDIMTMILAEVGVLTAIGSAAGYALIRVAVIWNQLSGRASLVSVGLSAAVDGAKVLAATMVCAIVLGLAPALRSTSLSTIDVLREE